MVLSSLGSEVDVSGAESITYEFMTETRNVASGFRSFFPDLPGKAIEVGDSWPSSNVINESTAAGNVRMDLQYINTLNGFETVDGMKCARITSKITGKISGSGFDWVLEGTYKGTDVWNFAPKEGIYVQSTSDSVSEMTISVSGEQAMTIPGTTTQRSEIRLTGR
jgi:hypothetical protein